MSSYLDLNGYPVLEGLGKVSKQQAEDKAMEEYSKFRSLQDKNYESDFERMIKEIDTQNKD